MRSGAGAAHGAASARDHVERGEDHYDGGNENGGGDNDDDDDDDDDEDDRFDADADGHSDNTNLVSAVLVGALYPHVARAESGGAGVFHSGHGGTGGGSGASGGGGATERCSIHPSSVCRDVPAFSCPFLVFNERRETSKLFLLSCAVATPYALLLFGGDIAVEHEARVARIDGWIELGCGARAAALLRELRAALAQGTLGSK